MMYLLGCDDAFTWVYNALMLEVDSTLSTEIDALQRQQVYKILSELEVVA
jgi:hypothetical protein